MPVNHGVNSGSHSRADRGLDLYSTPPGAVRALLKAESLPHKIWECAAGRGSIVTTLRDAGHAVVASDIVQYDFPLHFVGDFLDQKKVPAGVECTLTNPPFDRRTLACFVAHALDLCPLVVMFANLRFLESDDRTDIIERRGLARIHVFRGRLPMMHREGWAGKKCERNPAAFAWFVWERGHRGPATIHRLDYDWAPGELPVKTPKTKSKSAAPRSAAISKLEK